jgi:hypothetical protein
MGSTCSLDDENKGIRSFGCGKIWMEDLRDSEVMWLELEAAYSVLSSAGIRGTSLQRQRYLFMDYVCLIKGLGMATMFPTFCRQLLLLWPCSLHELILTNEESKFPHVPPILVTPSSMSGLIYLIERTSGWALCSSATRCWNQRREIIARDSLPWLNELGGHHKERDNPRYMHRGARWHPKILTLCETRVMVAYSVWKPLIVCGHCPFQWY